MVLEVGHGLGHVLAETLHSVPVRRFRLAMRGLVFVRGVVACFDLPRARARARACERAAQQA